MDTRPRSVAGEAGRERRQTTAAGKMGKQTEEGWRPHYRAFFRDLKVALSRKRIKAVLEPSYEHHFVVGQGDHVLGAVLMRLSATGNWKLNVEWFERWTVDMDLRPIAVLLTGRTRGYVVEPKRLEHLRAQWGRSADGAHYLIPERHVRACPRFTTAEEGALALVEAVRASSPTT